MSSITVRYFDRYFTGIEFKTSDHIVNNKWKEAVRSQGYQIAFGGGYRLFIYSADKTVSAIVDYGTRMASVMCRHHSSIDVFRFFVGLLR